MRHYFKIALFLALPFLSFEGSAQKEENVIKIESQDDLGNVNDEFQEHFFEALKQKAIENHEKAITALNKCLAFDSSQTVVYLELGKNYNALEKFSEAATYLEKARKTEPENEAILTELYQTYYLDKDFERAMPVVEQLTALNSSFSEDLANIYIINERYEEALRLLDEIDRRWGSSEYRNSLRHQIYVKTDDSKGYIRDLQGRIEEDPEDEQNYLNLIYVYSEEGNSEKAFETARKLQEMNPSSELVHLALYKYYLLDDQPVNALESMKILFRSSEIDQDTKYKVLNDYLIFIAKNPGLENDLMAIVEILSEGEGNAALYRQLGTFFLELDRKEQAMEFFEKSLGEDLNDFAAIKATILLQLEAREFASARELSERALENYPSQPLLYLLNGTALNGLEEYEQAEEMLTFGLDYLIDDVAMEAEFYRQLAVTYQGLGNDEKAVEFQRKVAKLEKQLING